MQSSLSCCRAIQADQSSCFCAQDNPKLRILVAGHENLVWGFYQGKQRSMMITNCIFRLGGVAYLLSNHPSDARRAKYRLQHVVRAHLGASDMAYKYEAFLRSLPGTLKVIEKEQVVFV